MELIKSECEIKYAIISWTSVEKHRIKSQYINTIIIFARLIKISIRRYIGRIAYNIVFKGRL